MKDNIEEIKKSSKNSGNKLIITILICLFVNIAICCGFWYKTEKIKQITEEIKRTNYVFSHKAQLLNQKIEKINQTTEEIKKTSICVKENLDVFFSINCLIIDIWKKTSDDWDFCWRHIWQSWETLIKEDEYLKYLFNFFNFY